MGINARIETEHGKCLAELLDPHNPLNWLLSLAALDSTVCLQFINPYGDTVFNNVQMPVLQSEFSALASSLTEANLEAKRMYLQRAAHRPKFEETQERVKKLSLSDLRNHLEQLLLLLSDARPPLYVRFVSD